MKALGAGTVFDDRSKFSSVSLHDSPKVLSGLLSIKLGLIETIRIIHSTLYGRKGDLFLSLCLSVLLLSFFDRPWGLVTVSQNAFHCTSAI